MAPPATPADRTPRVTTDILFNLLGKGWVALATVLFAPFFIQFLGIEAYGLLGFFTTLQTVLLLVDFGFSTTLNRAVAATRDNITPDIHALARALERTFFIFAAVILAAIHLAAPWIAAHWLKTATLATGEVRDALRLMGAAIALQLPFMLYTGGLTGLGRQINLNVILLCCTTLRFGGGLVALALTRRLEAFLLWQIVAMGLQTAWARRDFFRALTSRTARGDPASGVLKKHARFTAGVGLTAILGVALTQLDKLILSKLLPLEDYGYYIMAWTLSTTLFLLAGPVVTAFFPRLSAEIARPQGHPDALYHTGHQILSAVVVPAASLLLLVPAEVLTLWVGAGHASTQTSTLIAMLSLGTWLNTAAQFPHALQLAYGFSHFGLYANIILALLAVPSLYWGVSIAGAEGAAWVWIALNAGYVLVGVPLMHRWLLRGQCLHWLGLDLLLPALTGFAATRVLVGSLPWTAERSLSNLFSLGTSYAVAVMVCLVVSGLMRRMAARNQGEGAGH